MSWGSLVKKLMKAKLQSKSVTPSTSQQVVTADEGFDGLGQVSVGKVNLQSKTVTPQPYSQTVKPDSSYHGLSQVSVNSGAPSFSLLTTITSAQNITKSYTFSSAYDYILVVATAFNSSSVDNSTAIVQVEQDVGEAVFSNSYRDQELDGKYVSASGLTYIRKNVAKKSTLKIWVHYWSEIKIYGCNM